MQNHNFMPNKIEKNKFSLKIIELAASDRINHIEAIAVYCEQNNLEIEVAASMINDHLKKLIQTEAQELRFLPRSGKVC